MVKAKKRFTSKKKPIAKRNTRSVPRRIAPKKKVVSKNDLVEIEEPTVSEKVEQTIVAPSQGETPAQATPLSKDVASLDEYQPPPAVSSPQATSSQASPATAGVTPAVSGEVTNPTVPQPSMPAAEGVSSMPAVSVEAKPVAEGVTETQLTPASSLPATTFTPIETSLETIPSSHSNKKMLILIFVILLLILVSAGAYYYLNYMNGGKKGSNIVATVTETPMPSNTPTPTEASISAEMLAPYQVRVLNGSGVAGEANRVADSLEEVGFEKVARGNAPAYSSDDTEVAMKEDTPEDIYNTIKKVLEENYTVVKADENLTESSKYDVVITVGSKASE